MRRLIFLGILCLLSFSLTVGCSSKKRTRKKDSSENQTADAGENGNQADGNGGGAEANDNAANAENAGNNANEADGSPAKNAPASNARRPRGMRPGDNLSIGGIPNPPAGGQNPAPRQGVRRRRGGMRPGDNLSIGGVGNIPTDIPRGPRLDARGRPITEGQRRRRPAGGGPAFAGGGLPNGFFPQPSGGGTTFDANGALPNGFFPQSMGGGVVAAPPPPKPSATFRSAAQSAFEQRNGEIGMNNMYAYILSEEKNIEKYPIRYFPGINKAKVALKWGIGVTYTNKSEISTPLVIGDPEGVRETSGRSRSSSSRSRGGSRGNAGGGSFERPGGGGSRANSSSSDYGSVNVENPEGFLLYYTGDYGDKFLTRLESRMKHKEGFYGDIYRDFEVDYSSESTGATGAAAPRRNNGVRRQTRRNDNLSVGGGGNRGGGNRGGIGGNNAASSRSDRLKRLLTNSQASAPAADTTGLIMPGVFLVGEGKSNILFERAKNLELDVLVIFTVRVSTARKSTGTTSLKIYNLHTTEKPRLIDGRSLKSDRVAAQREGLTDAAKDPVELALDKIFGGEEGADKILKAVDIPEEILAQKKGVQSRVETLSKSKPKNILPAVVEVLNYNAKGLLEEKMLRQALNRLMGGVLGDSYLDGDEKAKAEILKRYVNKTSQPAGGGIR